jgi:hypothetical protein
MSSKFSRFIKLPLREKMLFGEALFFVYLAKVVSAILPFKYCVRLMFKDLKNETPPDHEFLLSLKEALLRAENFIFWKNACLLQSFAAKWMLNRRNIKSTMFFGFNFDEEKKFIAHAWVQADEIEIVAKGDEYAELHSI